ncbi:unnamed protein product [Symbiodinium sp. CCMP2456]|nr:unnamed protein product [Symbiodinium sp. CCMP2456]
MGRRKRVLDAAIDSTGLEATCASVYFVRRRTTKDSSWKTIVYQRYPKLSLVSDVRTNFILAYRVFVRGKTVDRGKARKADYLLFYQPNLPIAVVESKDNNHSVGDRLPRTRLMLFRIGLLVSFIFALGCTDRSEPDPGPEPVVTSQEVLDEVVVVEGKPKITDDQPAMAWVRMEFEDLPKVEVPEAPQPLPYFSGEEQPAGTQVPEDVQLLLESYDKKDFGQVAELARTYPQREVRLAAMKRLELLVEDDNHMMIQTLRAGLQDDDSDFRAKVLLIFRGGVPYWDKQVVVKALPELAGQLRDTSPLHSDVVGIIFKELGPVALPALPQLCWAAGHGNSYALEAIGEIGSKASVAIPLVTELTWDERSSQGAVALGKLQVEAEVLKLLKDSDVRTKGLGASAARYIKAPSRELVVELLSAANDPAAPVCAYSAEALGNIRPTTPEIAGALFEVPKHEIPWVNHAVYDAIAKLDPPAPEGLDFLNRRLAETNEEENREAIQEAITTWKANNKSPVTSLLEDVVAEEGEVSDPINDQAQEIYEPLKNVLADKSQPNAIRGAALLALDSVHKYLEEGQAERSEEITALARACLAEKPEQPLFGAITHVLYGHNSSAEDADRLLAEGVVTKGFLIPRLDDVAKIGYLKIEEGLPALIDLIEQKEMSVMLVLLSEIGSFGDKAADAVPGIVKLDIDPNDKKNVTLFKNQLIALGEIGARPDLSIPFLKNLLDTTDPAMWERGDIVRALALVVAKNDEDPKFVLEQAGYLLDNQLTNHMAALDALKTLGPKAAPMVSKITPCLGQVSLSWFACEALEAIGPDAQEAEPALVELVRTADNKHRAIRALGAIRASSPEFKKLATEMLESDVEHRGTMTEVLGELGTSSAEFIPQIQKLLESPKTMERVYAARALGNIGEAAKPDVDHLKKLAEKDPDYSVKEAAREAVKKLDPQQSDES